VTIGRAVALGQASAVLGAAAAGFGVGLVLYFLPRLGELAAARSELPPSMAALVCGALLLAAGLFLESSCTTPPEDDEAMSQAASRHLEESMEAYRKGDLETAIDKLKEGIGIDPLSFQLHYHLGLLYGRGDRLFDAIHELETAVDLQARNFSALKNLAVLYQRAGFKHKAIEMWERALGTAPDDETRQGIKEHLMNLL